MSARTRRKCACGLLAWVRGTHQERDFLRNQVFEQLARIDLEVSRGVTVQLDALELSEVNALATSRQARRRAESRDQ